MKLFWIILGVAVAGLIGIFIATNKSDSTPPVSNSDLLTISANDHVRGSADAPATLIEYGDFQCPACGHYYPIVKELEKTYGNKLRVIFRHFPLTSIHPQAFDGSRAAEAASAQGKFWEMHDLLYEHQNDWTNPQAVQTLRQYAQQLGLNLDQFNNVMGAGATSDRINQDIHGGQQLGISSTPTFYLNGQKLDPTPRDPKEFKTQIDSVLNGS